MGAYEPSLFPGRDLSNVPGEQKLKLQITYGSSAPASYWGKDIVAVRDTATGKVTICFPRTYRKLTGFRWGWVKCQAGAVYFPVILTNAVDTADATTGGGTVVLETRTEAGTATDPASGDILALEFTLSNDILCDRYAGVIT